MTASLTQGDLPPCNSVFIYDSENGERTLKCNLLSRTKTSQNLPSLSFKVCRPTLIMGWKYWMWKKRAHGKRSQVFFSHVRRPKLARQSGQDRGARIQFGQVYFGVFSTSCIAPPAFSSVWILLFKFLGTWQIENPQMLYTRDMWNMSWYVTKSG